MTSSPEPDVSERNPGEWTISVERTLGAVSKQGSAVVRQNDVTHARLAGARAWSAVGRGLQGEGAFEDASTAARNGIEELGKEYAPRTAVDDTALKLRAAAERIAAGHPEDGAEVLLRVLDTRMRLYVARYGDAIVE